MQTYKIENGKLICESQNLDVYGNYDVVVVGGGMAGVGAALAACKEGAKTIIIENLSSLGGISSNGIVNITLDFLSAGGKEFYNEMEKINGFYKRNTDPEKHKLVFERMLKKYGCEILLVTPIIDTVVENNTVKGVIIHTKKGNQVILGKRFVDASGDSDLVYFAGGETMTGREKDNMSMGCSLDFVLGGYNHEEYLASELCNNDPKWVKLIAEAVKNGELPKDIDNHVNWLALVPGLETAPNSGEVGICLCHSRNCYPTENKDLTRMYIEGREQVQVVADFIKKHVPGFENSFVAYTGSLLGVRESRRIKGEYVFTGMDIAYAKKFDDVIAISQHGFDIHGFEDVGNLKWFKGKLPDGSEAYISNRAGWGTQLPPDDGIKRINMSELAPKGVFYYDIPYRSLVPIKLENVLAAGRNISSDIPGQSGIRLVMCCMALGEAAGLASAMSIKENISPRQLDVGELQRRLVETGGNIGQGFNKIKSLPKKDYSKFQEKQTNTNG